MGGPARLSCAAAMPARETDSLLGHRSEDDDSSDSDELLGPGVLISQSREPSLREDMTAAWYLYRRQLAVLALGVGGFATICFANLGFGSSEFKTEAPAQRCLAMLGLVAILWATEAIPAHVTSLAVPLLAVVLRVLCVPRNLRKRGEKDTLLVPAYMCNSSDPAPGYPMPAEASASVAVGAFFNPLILLFVAGFSMSIVFDQHGISHRMAAALLRRLGTSPATVGLGLMVCCVFASAVLGNVSAAVMATSLLRPTLVDEEIRRSSWPQFALLAVAFASNIGGMLSPVASPQNLIAFTAIETVVQTASTGNTGTNLTDGKTSPLTFGAWVAAALPFCVVLVLLCWVFLWLTYRKQLPSALPPITIDHARPGKGGSTLSTVFIVVIALLTITLWVVFDHVAAVKETFGHIGVIGLIPIVCFGSCGYISTVDFNGMPWDLLVLIGGGLSLGLAVESSGLLVAIGDRLTQSLSTDLGTILLAFSCLVAVLANFISSTVAAVILLPLVATVGNTIGHPKLLVTLCAFMTSGAMGLPVRDT